MRITTSLLAVAVLSAAAGAQATSFPIVGFLDADYFTVTSGGAGDFQTQCCSDRPNLVAPTLGTNGLPIFTPDGGPTIKGVDAMTGEIQWWTTGVTSGGDTVTASGSGIVSLPFSDTSFFQPTGNGASNANGYLTAHFQGLLNLTQGTIVTASIGADDDAFVFINNTLVAGLGGVHAVKFAPQGSIFLPGGSYDVDVFFADRYRTQSSLQLALSGSHVPEPATWALLISGFGLVGMAARRRRTMVAAA